MMMINDHKLVNIILHCKRQARTAMSCPKFQCKLGIRMGQKISSELDLGLIHNFGISAILIPKLGLGHRSELL